MMMRFSIPIFALMLGMLATPGSAQTPLITDPEWAAKPTGADIARFAPSAMASGTRSKVLLECRVKADGRLEACAVVSEDPPGLGFGKAALRMATKFRMKPRTMDGQPVAGARVRVPVNFAGDGSPELPSLTGSFVYASPAPDVRSNGGEVAKAAYYLALEDRKSGRNPIVAEVVLVLDHPLAGGGKSQSYVVLRQVLDCTAPRVATPGMQFFDDAGQRTSWTEGRGQLQPVRPEFQLDRLRALACGQAQPDSPLLGSIAEVRADARARFAAAAVK
jgi:TonB family protein